MGKKIIFTNGCFDIIHRGHLELLRFCRSLGDEVIVGLNSDESVQRLKGSNRPVVSQNDRKKLLEEFRCVDKVYIFEEDDPYKLLQCVQPDIIVKGGDYLSENVIGSDLAEVVIFNTIDGYSTTQIIDKSSLREN